MTRSISREHHIITKYRTIGTPYGVRGDVRIMAAMKMNFSHIILCLQKHKKKKLSFATEKKSNKLIYGP